MPTGLSELSPVELAARARLAIENTLGAPEIAALVGPAGYTEPTLSAALADVAALEAATSTQVGQYGTQQGRTHLLATSRKDFHDGTYMPHAALARVEFRAEPGTLARLGLSGERARAFHDWAAQVRQLYTTVLADPGLRSRLAARGLPQAALEAALAALDSLAESERAQEDAKGLAQQSTRDRDALRLRVAAWLGDYRETAQVMLRARPEWLERLGFLHRTDAPPEIEP